MERPLRLAKSLASLLAPIAIVLVAGSNIPLPGIDPEFFGRQASGNTGSAMERLSVLALGLTPILNGLAIGEICIGAWRFLRHVMADTEGRERE